MRKLFALSLALSLALGLLAQAPPAPPKGALPVSQEVNATLYQYLAEFKLLQEYQKELTSQIQEKQAAWAAEVSKALTEAGKKCSGEGCQETWTVQEDPSSKPSKWVLVEVPKPAAPPAAPPAQAPAPAKAPAK